MLTCACAEKLTSRVSSICSMRSRAQSKIFRFFVNANQAYLATVLPGKRGVWPSSPDARRDAVAAECA
jgi:hypothetical protein